MDISRNSVKTRAFMEWRCLPVGWVISQTHFGAYLKIVNERGGYTTIFHAKNWRELCTFCEGVLAANGIRHTRGGTFKEYAKHKGV